MRSLVLSSGSRRRAALFVGLLFLGLGAVGCGHHQLYYDATELRHPAFSTSQKAALTAAVAEEIGADHRVDWVDNDGKSHALHGSSAELAQLGLAELGALWLAGQGTDRGAEADIRVRTAQGKTAVTVLRDLDGNWRVESGRRSAPSARTGEKRSRDVDDQVSRGDDDDDEPTLSESEIRARFGLSAALPGRWQEPERRALTQALALLSDEELAILRTIPFEREEKAVAGNPGQAALYVQNGCRAKIFLYPTGITSDRFRFVGEARDPKSAVLHALVHEMGHAVAAAPARQRYCAAEAKRGAQKNALIEEANAWMREGPVLSTYEAALAGLPAPTDYGNTSPAESFAESFALFHVDRAALVRARPAVAAWFARGGVQAALHASR